jgi:FKBP-type peptidyl-prolyl cis-trans isomerase FkpA
MNRAIYSLALCLVVLASACTKQNGPDSNAPAASQPAIVAPAQAGAAVTELRMEDSKIGTGALAKSGNLVSIHYTGWLADGKRFVSSRDRNEPFNFVLGAGQVIKGWDQGVTGMKVGGVRKLTVPPKLGYGGLGEGGAVPPNATLVFEVELLSVN